MNELETMEPNPEWDADAHGDVVDALADDSLTFRVWGGDWCPDCTGQLPDFAAALAAAGVPADRIEQYPVEKVDGEKQGPGMDEYGVDYIPTVIVERDGQEVARFVEEEDAPIATYLARKLGAVEA
ncbi:thioredoxin family protein [Halobaculum sp. D14]|uniref:thioredoxin family protein n=1 Tax=unclassified Halobaculum TaxID=2640896 RepID=UPI003EBDDF6B